jgi:U6 snRNA phosphodiesterase
VLLFFFRAWPRFKASFATFSELTNDEETRTFLTLEIGAGHNEVTFSNVKFGAHFIIVDLSFQLRALSEALTPTLHSFRQKEFYTDPRFHASIAWALLDVKSNAVPSGAKSIPDSLSALQTERHLEGSITSALSSSVPPRMQNGAMLINASDSTPSHPLASTPQEPPTVPKHPLREFPTIPHLSPTLIPTLNAKFTAELTRANVGVFEVGEVKVKIGKWVGGWALQG